MLPPTVCAVYILELQIFLLMIFPSVLPVNLDGKQTVLHLVKSLLLSRTELVSYLLIKCNPASESSLIILFVPLEEDGLEVMVSLIQLGSPHLEPVLNLTVVAAFLLMPLLALSMWNSKAISVPKRPSKLSKILRRKLLIMVLLSVVILLTMDLLLLPVLSNNILPPKVKSVFILVLVVIIKMAKLSEASEPLWLWQEPCYFMLLSTGPIKQTLLYGQWQSDMLSGFTTIFLIQVLVYLLLIYGPSLDFL